MWLDAFGLREVGDETRRNTGIWSPDAGLCVAKEPRKPCKLPSGSKMNSWADKEKVRQSRLCTYVQISKLKYINILFSLDRRTTHSLQVAFPLYGIGIGLGIIACIIEKVFQTLKSKYKNSDKSSQGAIFYVWN